MVQNVLPKIAPWFRKQRQPAKPQLRSDPAKALPRRNPARDAGSPETAGKMRGSWEWSWGFQGTPMKTPMVPTRQGRFSPFEDTAGCFRVSRTGGGIPPSGHGGRSYSSLGTQAFHRSIDWDVDGTIPPFWFGPLIHKEVAPCRFNCRGSDG